MKVLHGRAQGVPSKLRGDTFTNTVWADPVLPTTEGVTINTVFFSPGARTYWHAHEHGQVLHVTAGSGWVCSDDGTRQVIRSGDLVWISPGERHWHGASHHSYMVHVAISLGKTEWQEEVADSDYTASAD